MHNLESILENQLHKIILNFETQTDHPILARRLVLELINKEQSKVS